MIWLRVVFRSKVVKNELKGHKKPALIIGNHVTFEDPILAIMYTNRTISYLAASINMENKFKKYLFKLTRVIPFTKGQMDINAIRQLKKCINNSKSVGLYPEGGRTWDGCDIEILESIASLVKLLRVDVYTVDLQGFYFIKPRWAKKYRHGKTTMEIRKVIDEADIRGMSPTQILETIHEGIAYNEYERQRISPVAYRGRDLAESIEKVLFMCPECNAIDSITSLGNEFWCTECSKKYSVDEYGFISGCQQFDNPHDWNVWQSNYIDSIIETNLPFVNDNVPVTMVHQGSRKTTRSTVTISSASIQIDDINIPYTDIQSPNIVFTNVLEFFLPGQKIRLRLHPKKHSSITMLEKILKKMVAST